MAHRTFAIGDIHGDLVALRALIQKLPLVAEEDTLVFLGDYVDRGPQSAEVVRVVRALERDVGCRVVCLRGNHEDGWLRARREGWPEFVLPPPNGCLAAMRSFLGEPQPVLGELPKQHELESLMYGRFLPEDVVEWMQGLPYFYEDEHGIYVHAGLIEREGRFLHPSETEPKTALLWTRSQKFFREYDGKHVVVGHTATDYLPQELSQFTPEDPTDLWAGKHVTAIDTGAGKSGFLTALELPAFKVYESR